MEVYMQTKSTHRVVTFLSREELEFLDKLEKDIMFSSGTYISRSKIIEDIVALLSRTSMDATGIKDNDELERKMMEAIAASFCKKTKEAGNETDDTKKL